VFFISSRVTSTNDSTVVNYGLSASSLPLVASGRTITYSAGGWAGFIHYATLTGLKPSSTYFYTVGSNANGFTDVYHFETRPAVGAYPLDWVVIGDMGADPQALNTISRVSALASPNTVGGILHIGDIGYQDGVQHRWDLYMRMIQTMSGYLPYMVRKPFVCLLTLFSRFSEFLPRRPFLEIMRLLSSTTCTSRVTSIASRCLLFPTTTPRTCKAIIFGPWIWDWFTLLVLTLSIPPISLMSPTPSWPG
jgi:hypothetical protein